MIKWRGIERVDIHFLLSANSFRISNVPALFVSPILIVLQFFTHFRSTRYRTCRKLKNRFRELFLSVIFTKGYQQFDFPWQKL